MTDHLRWGILGPGYIAIKQTEALIAAGLRVTAVGSRSAASAQKFVDHFGLANVQAHGSYTDLVNDPEVDIVYVATPHSRHFDHAKLALLAGKHVLLEKAFTVTGDQAEVLVALAAERDLVLLEAMWTRHLPHMVRLREILAAGTIGEVRTVIADHNQSLPTEPEHRLNDPKLAGGALLDLGIYPVSFAFDVLGAPTSVQATASFTATGVDRQTSIVLGYDNGAHALLQCALDTPGPNTASVVGTAGWVSIDRVWYAPTGFTVYAPDGSVIERFENDSVVNGMQYQALEVERLVHAGLIAGKVMPPEQTVQIMRVLDEIRAQVGLEYPGDILAM